MSEVSTRTKAILLTAVVVALLLATVIGMVYFRKISSTGRIKTVGCDVFWDSGLTQRVESIDWGTLEPGEEHNVSVYIINTSNVAASLMLGTENWIPNATSNYITLYWNYDNHTMAVDDVVPVILTLAVSEDITGITNFSFDIIVIAYG